MSVPRWNQWLSRTSLFQRVLYPTPEPLPRTRAFWWATGLVMFAALVFAAFFIVYLTRLQDAYLTHAEDLGIMDQAIWNTVHGRIMQQTICNIVGDTNCVSTAGISRFAIHFEPILFLVSLFYWFASTPKTLVVLQTLVVASGAFPAFWLARLRLRNEWAGVAIALLYLLFPAQQHATLFDFHAVTLTVAFVMFLLYFLYTRQTVWLFVFAVLSLACKEEIAGVIALCGLWTLLLQRRWRSGLGLILLAFAWTGIALFVIHLSSPTGHSLLTARYSYLGTTPTQIVRSIVLHPSTLLKEHVLEHTHVLYLRLLLSPTAYLALLAPWVLVLGSPTLLLNLFSTDPQMYSGLFQYNAELVPILVFSTIEALVVLLWLLRFIFVRLRAMTPAPRLALIHQGDYAGIGRGIVLSCLLGLVVLATVRADAGSGTLPLSPGFQWPQQTAHVALAQAFLRQIPPKASLSAQSALVPHVSHRASIYLFPYADTSADYVFLDVTSDIYPFFSSADYIREAKKVLLSGKYGVVDAHDGYILLKKGTSAPGLSPSSVVKPSPTTDAQFVLPALPTPFCSYLVQPAHQTIPNPVHVLFKDSDDVNPTMALVGVHVNAPSRFSISAGYMSVTTYWRVLASMPDPLQIAVLVTDHQGREKVVSTDMPSMVWCQTQTWKPGMLMRVTSQVFSLHALGLHTGSASVSLALIPLLEPPDHVNDVSVRQPLAVQHTSRTVVSNPTTKTVSIMRLTLVA